MPGCAQVLANPSAFDVAVTTYDMMHSADLGKALCRTIHWRYLVLDEGHKIKNEHTLVSQSMRHTKCARACLKDQGDSRTSYVVRTNDILQYSKV